MTQKTIRKMKQFFSLMLVLVMMIGIITPGSATVVKAEDYDGYVYVTVERFTLGQGLAAEPKKVGYFDEDSLETLLKRAYGEEAIVVSDGEYRSFDGFIDGGEPEGWSTADIPEKIIEALGVEGEYTPAITVDDITPRTKNDTLSNYDYTGQSYLMVCVDNQSAQLGISDLKNGTSTDGRSYHDGSVIRIEYGIYNYGGDLNITWGTPLIDFPNKDDLIRAIVDYIGSKKNKAYVNAVKTLEDWDATEDEVDKAITNIEEVTNNAKVTQEKYTKVLNSTLKTVKETYTNPGYKDEWIVLSVERSGMGDKLWSHKYIHNIEKEVKKNKSNIFDKTKPTENSRVIIGLTAAGANAEDVAGYNLVEPLADYDFVSGQSVNSILYALIALDFGGYDVPKLKGEGNQTTREKLIDGLLNARSKDGGWNWYPEADGLDVDTTCMAIQALAPYYNSNTSVKEAVDAIIPVLSEKQNATGEYYYSYNGENYINSCTTAQVLCALSELGIDSYLDDRFIKNDNSILDALVSFYNSEYKGFNNYLDDEEINPVATEQALYSLVSLDRMLTGKGRLYDSSDVEFKGYKTEIKNAKEPTCTEKGYTGDKVCSQCGEILEKGKEIAAKGHTPVEIPAIPATETTPGKTAGKKCSVCGEVLEAPKDIPATGKKEGPVQQTVVATPQFVSDGYEANGSKLTYKDDNDSTAKKLVIPATIKEDGKTYKVTKIAAGACKGNKNLTSVSVGKNVTSIGKKAFNGCSKLKTITIKGKVTSVGKNAFAGISKKATIKIKASKKQYKKTVKLIKKSGIPKTVKFKRV